MNVSEKFLFENKDILTYVCRYSLDEVIANLQTKGYKTIQEQMTTDGLFSYLDSNIPVLITLKENSERLLATAYDDNYIYFESSSGIKWLSQKEFLTSWDKNSGIAIRTESSLPDHKVVTHLLLDFDHVIILYDKFSEEYKLKSGFVSILKKRKDKKINFEQAAKELDFDMNKVRNMLNNITPHIKFNPEIKTLIDSFAKVYPELQVVIATNNCPYVVAYFLKYLKIEKYFNFLWCPEKANWFWKPHREYYLKFQQLIKTKFENMLLVDDDKENCEMMSSLGGQSVFYDKGRITTDTKERIE